MLPKCYQIVWYLLNLGKSCSKSEHIMGRVILFIGVLLISITAFAQSKLMKDASDAVLVDFKGNVICGKAKVDLKEEWVQIQSKDEFRVIEFEKIRELRLFNDSNQSLTSYHRYPLNNHESKLLEQIAIGSVHLVRKVKPQQLQTPMSSTYLNSPRHTVSKQYFLWNEGTLSKVKSFKKQIQSMMSTEEHGALSAFQKENKLSYHDDHDQSLMVNYLNQLRKEQLAFER